MEIYNEKDAAEQLGCSVALLRKWRQQKQGPRVVKMGRLVRYRAADLEQFLNDHTRGVAGGGQQA